MKFTTEQLQVADLVDEMAVGQTVEIAETASLKGGYIYRESPTRYTVNDSAPMCFIQACDAMFS